MRKGVTCATLANKSRLARIGASGINIERPGTSAVSSREGSTWTRSCRSSSLQPHSNHSSPSTANLPTQQQHHHRQTTKPPSDQRRTTTPILHLRNSDKFHPLPKTHPSSIPPASPPYPWITARKLGAVYVALLHPSTRRRHHHHSHTNPDSQPRDDVYGAYDASYLQTGGPKTATQSPIVTGTSVIAIKYKDGVVMAADNLGMPATPPFYQTQLTNQTPQPPTAP